MDRVRNHISFAVWFVGLTYLAVWPAAGSAVPALSPGLHLAGMMAVFWVSAKLIVILCGRLMATLLPPQAQMAMSTQRLIATLRHAMQQLFRRSEPPPRYVPPRREFGLRRDRR